MRSESNKTETHFHIKVFDYIYFGLNLQQLGGEGGLFTISVFWMQYSGIICVKKPLKAISLR
jgi:hypothetical protein